MLLLQLAGPALNTRTGAGFYAGFMAKYKVIFTHLRDANGNDHFNGEILTAEEIGNWELHLSRGAIEEVVEPEPQVVPEPEPKPKTPKK